MVNAVSKMTELEELRRNRKQSSRERQADAAEEGRAVADKIRDLEEEVKNLDVKLTDFLLQMPNIPSPQVPVGKDSSENVVIRSWGEPKKLPFPSKTALGIR